jgi:hypothetical protein
MVQCSEEDTLVSCAKINTGKAFEFLEQLYFIENLHPNWPFKNELSLSSFALLQEPSNTLNPRTTNQDNLFNSKCPENVLVNGRYRVERNVFQNTNTCYNSEYEIARFGNAADAENACTAGCSGWIYVDSSYITVNQLELAGYEEVSFGAPDLSVSEAECEAYAESQNFLWNPNNDEGGRPNGCWRQLGASSMVHWNSIGGASCSSGPCIQKKRNHTTYKKVSTTYPAHMGKKIMYRNNLCDIKNVSGIEFDETGFHFGFIDNVECNIATNTYTYDSSTCIFPFYIPQFDVSQQKVVTTKITSCTDLNMEAGAGDTLFDFQSIKPEIQSALNIEPKYCVTKPWFQNISFLLENHNSSRSACRKNTGPYKRCGNSIDSIENCNCGDKTCAINEYCYEQVVNNIVQQECYACNDMLSPSPEYCCQTNEYLQTRYSDKSTCIAESDAIDYCAFSYACPRNFGVSQRVDANTYYMVENGIQLEYTRGGGPKPELFCDNTCWNAEENVCNCNCEKNHFDLLRATRIGAYHYGALGNSLDKNEFNLDFLRLCKDPFLAIVNNDPNYINSDNYEIFAKTEFIRTSRDAASNPSSKCDDDCMTTCPGMRNGVPCSGNGVCNKQCSCSCFTLGGASGQNYFLSTIVGVGIAEIPEYGIGSAAAFKSPFRGSA